VISSSPVSVAAGEVAVAVVVMASVAAAASVAEAHVVQHGAASRAQQRMEFPREPDGE
jgi:hypothetical protein